MKLGMKIGGTYRLHEIDASRWGKWAEEAGLTPDRVMGIVRTTAHRIMESVAHVEDSIRVEHDSPFLRKLGDAIKSRAASCTEMVS